jgi:hypothetical protein
MFEIKVEITWKIIRIGISPIYYIDVLICNNGSVNSIFEFTNINGMNILKL